MRTGYCTECMLHQPLIDHPTLGWVCARCLRPIRGMTRQRDPLAPRRHAHVDHDCPVCGAPQGELCIMFDPTKKGRRSIGTLKLAHPERAAA